MLKCLIIEDDQLSREMLALQLENYAQCDHADNGQVGVELFEAALKEGRGYDLILLDIIMPEMDGLDAARAIRRLEELNGTGADQGVNIIVLSSLNTPQDVIQAYVSAQSAAHLVKPVKPERLLRTLRKLGLIEMEN